ncbi:MAG: GNAT family N-acetyltransferase [Actinomycetota bacterium]
MIALRPATRGLRELHDADLPALRAMLDADPIANAAVTARLEAAGKVRGPALGGWFLGAGEPIDAACYVGGSVAPIGGDPAAWDAFAARLAAAPRRCSSLIGAVDAVEALRLVLERSWGPARIIRLAQPLLAADAASVGVAGVAADPDVRPASRNELASYLPAAAAMFAEELGVAPFDGPRRPTHLDRLAELIAAGRVLVKIDTHGQVVFKAELAAVTARTCQVQGVWVRPDIRGRGLGTAAMATVLRIALTRAPTASLYVNDFNTSARRMYARLGMREVGTLSTVLF